MESDPLTCAVSECDLPRIRSLVAGGADINAVDAFGTPFVHRATLALSPHPWSCDDDRRCAVMELLIDLGADVHRLDHDGGSILMGPIFGMDLQMVELLLVRGIDPNRGCSDPGETVFDAACFDYRVEAWVRSGVDMFPDLSAQDGDALVRELERNAAARGCLKPDILMLLRRHGALSGREMARMLGGRPGEAIIWLDDGWQLALSP